MSQSRRSFLRQSLVAAGAASAIASSIASAATPARPSGAKSVFGLKCKPMEKVRVGIVGLGMRGSGAVSRILKIPGFEIVALCDIREEKLKAAVQKLEKAKRPAAKTFTGHPEAWKKLCELPEVDLVYNCTPWQLHTPISVFAMLAGKHAATEVPAATSIEECWQLVDTAERTQRNCMMLENCCYGETELFALNLCRMGMLGELQHGEAAYIHELRALKFAKDTKGYWDRWRLDFAKKINGNPYPTHGLGPVAQYMGINRGDRFDHLVSMSCRQRGLTIYAEETFGPNSPEAKETYRLGDMNTSLIRTTRGRTIMVQHDTTSPRPYSRINLISGTKGCFADYPPRLALLPKAHEWVDGDGLRKNYLDKYQHPLWKRLSVQAKKDGGHGGMDYIMDWRIAECLMRGEPLDQDVYDAAALSSVFPLSCESVANGSASVKVPDFTRGTWETNPPLGIIA